MTWLEEEELIVIVKISICQDFDSTWCDCGGVIVAALLNRIRGGVIVAAAVWCGWWWPAQQREERDVGVVWCG